MTELRRTADPTLSPALRVEALEALLLERGLVDAATIETIIRTYETAVGPMNGAKVVAKAWTDPEYKRQLLEDGTVAIASPRRWGRGSTTTGAGCRPWSRYSPERDWSRRTRPGPARPPSPPVRRDTITRTTATPSTTDATTAERDGGPQHGRGSGLLWLALPVRLVAGAGGGGCGGPWLAPGAAGRDGCDSRGGGGCGGGGRAAGSCGVGVGPVGADGVGTGA
jgi:hypothetical protein